jgi:hypothetical protein
MGVLIFCVRGEAGVWAASWVKQEVPSEEEEREKWEEYWDCDIAIAGYWDRLAVSSTIAAQVNQGTDYGTTTL